MSALFLVYNNLCVDSGGQFWIKPFSNHVTLAKSFNVSKLPFPPEMKS